MFVVSGVPGRLYHPSVCWRDNTTEQNQTSKFLECIDDNFPAQMIDTLMKVDAVLDLVLTKSKEQVGDLHAGRYFGCSDREMVEFKILMEGTRQKAALSWAALRTLWPFQKS